MSTTVYSTNLWPLSSVIGSLPMINPSPFGFRVYQWQTPSDLGFQPYICRIHLHTSSGNYVHISVANFSCPQILVIYLSNTPISRSLYITYMYIIYKPWLVGVFNRYTTRVWCQRNFTTDKPWAQRARGLSVANYRWLRTRFIYLLNTP